MPKRFWAYSHNNDGDLISNLGESDTFTEAMENVIAAIEHDLDNDPRTPDELETYRIVDEQANGSTVWLAISMKRMRYEAKANREWYVDHNITLDGDELTEAYDGLTNWVDAVPSQGLDNE